MTNKIICYIVLAVLLLSTRANAQINVFTEHQVIGMFQHGVNRFEGVPFPTGDVPYIGKLGFEYQRKKFTYSLAYIHRSNADLINQDEYNYNGVSLGIKYSHCITSC